MHLIRRTDESNRCQLGIKTLEMVSCQNRQLSPFLILPIVNLNLFAFFIKKKKILFHISCPVSGNTQPRGLRPIVR